MDVHSGHLNQPGGAAYGGAIYADGDLTLTDTEVVFNSVEGDTTRGGAIYVGATGSLTISGTSAILANSSNGTVSGDGGAIYAEGTINSISAEAINSNTAAGSGGSIYANTINSISDTDFEDNEADQSGGAIFASFIGTISNSTFGDFNRAIFGNGGAIALTDGFTVINETTFQINESVFGSGGALWVESTNSATGTISDSLFNHDNCSGQDGNYIWLGNDSIVSIMGTTFQQAICSGVPDSSGGMIYSQGNLSVSNSTFTEHFGEINTGGAIHNENGTLLVQDSVFEALQVLSQTFAAGGAIYSVGDLTVLRSEFSENDVALWGPNTANGIAKGGAIYAVGQSEIVENIFRFNYISSQVSAPANSGGAIYAEGQTEITNNFFVLSRVEAGPSEVPDGSGGAIYLSVSQASTVFHNTMLSSLSFNGETIYASGPVTLNGNIIASTSNNPDCVLQGGVTGSNNLRLDGDTSCASISSGIIEPGVHVSYSNGLLQSVFGNPAIDGNPGCGLATDGLGNPRIGACDIGYHELQLSSPTPTPTGPVALIASAVCADENLAVTISAGDGPFNITASAGINTPVNGVDIGTHIINGPEKWDDLTVSETGGDMETTNLGTFRCRTDERPVPLSPAHRSRTTNPFPTFSWTGITGANNYRVFVFDDANPATRTVDIRQNSGGPTTMILSTPLPTGRLFWRVRARTNRVWSYWSIRFTLFVDPPSFQPAGVTPVPTIELDQPASTPVAPTVMPPTFPAPPNSR